MPRREWTVVFYLCGSVLESRHSCATENLREIASCYMYAVSRNLLMIGRTETPDTTPSGVNVVIETGGSREWHAQELGMEIRPDRLQRWIFHPVEQITLEGSGTFELAEELPLNSMADPETLADFIRWSAENYPAEKYALVLWDHGGGSKTGILIDELFEGDTLYLDELGTALANGGTQLEAVLFDACLMANLETACAIQDSAKWMIASEELVAGKGTAMGMWLQQLYFAPQWDGERLGRWICEMTCQKYADETDDQARETLTWSVLDLSKIGRVEALFDQFFQMIGETYVKDSGRMMEMAVMLNSRFEFGMGNDNLIDLGGIFYEPVIGMILPTDLYYEMMDALAEAVVYNTHGIGRARAQGLSFCFATDFSPEELTVYARNCPSAHYLAFLDAVIPSWTAPEWVYETAEHLPPIQALADYQIQIEKRTLEDGTPGIAVLDGWDSFQSAHAELYQMNEETGLAVRLGSNAAYVDIVDGEAVYALKGFWMWPAIEGVHCDAEQLDLRYGNLTLFSIPVKIGSEVYQFRCGYDPFSEGYGENDLTVYGLWGGYETDGASFSRSVLPLSRLTGQEFRLLYPVDGTAEKGRRVFEFSEPLTIYRWLEMTAKELPPGTYYLDYWIRDIFWRRLNVGRAEIIWDGEKVTLSDPEAWQGLATLQTD